MCLEIRTEFAEPSRCGPSGRRSRVTFIMLANRSASIPETVDHNSVQFPVVIAHPPSYHRPRHAAFVPAARSINYRSRRGNRLQQGAGACRNCAAARRRSCRKHRPSGPVDIGRARTQEGLSPRARSRPPSRGSQRPARAGAGNHVQGAVLSLGCIVEPVRSSPPRSPRSNRRRRPSRKVKMSVPVAFGFGV